MLKKGSQLVYQFKISLIDIEPEIWRRIQVPAKYSFWDLHVAVQDSMGWLDYHLHAFRVLQKHKRKPIEIGIPDETGENLFLPGWEVPMTDYFTEPGETMLYEYDFGDSWVHEILLEAVLLKGKGVVYPRCIGGERACPPEDCGSIRGYYNLLEVLGDPEHEEHGEFIGWLKGHAKNYYPYNPERFNPEEVRFDNPKRRWRIAFDEPRGI